jgi:DNA invertase Pin-like site-specific DNA recombinase
VFGALAELERELTRGRTQAALDAARVEGRVGGRSTVMTPERREAARQMLDSGQQVAQVARTLGVGRATTTSLS